MPGIGDSALLKPRVGKCPVCNTVLNVPSLEEPPFHLVEPTPAKKHGWPALPFPEILFVLSGLAGAGFNASGSVWGFVIWLPGNVGLAVLNWKRAYKWQSVLFSAYTITAAWGIIRWLK